MSQKHVDTAIPVTKQLRHRLASMKVSGMRYEDVIECLIDGADFSELRIRSPPTIEELDDD